MPDKELQHVQHIRGSENASDAYTGLEGELTINRTSQSVRVHDGVTEGGHGTIYHARVNEIPAENNIPKDWAIGCRVIAGPGTIAGAGVVPLPELTDERVVATFNGKKVYEKLLVINGPTAAGQAQNMFSLAAYNIGTMVDIHTVLDRNYASANTVIPADYMAGSNDYIVVEYDKNSKNIRCTCGSGVGNLGGVLRVTIRYTKTTD